MATSWAGRMITCFVMISGVLVLALPIGVIGANFAQLYADWQRQNALTGIGKIFQIEALDTKSMVKLFDFFDTRKEGFLTQKVFVAGLKKMGIERFGENFDSEYAALFEEFDQDCDDQMDFEEFVIMCSKLQRKLRDLDEASEQCRDSPVNKIVPAVNDLSDERPHIEPCQKEEMKKMEQPQFNIKLSAAYSSTTDPPNSNAATPTASADNIKRGIVRMREGLTQFNAVMSEELDKKLDEQFRLIRREFDEKLKQHSLGISEQLDQLLDSLN